MANSDARGALDAVIGESSATSYRCFPPLLQEIGIALGLRNDPVQGAVLDFHTFVVRGFGDGAFGVFG